MNKFQIVENLPAFNIDIYNAFLFTHQGIDLTSVESMTSENAYIHDAAACVASNPLITLIGGNEWQAAESLFKFLQG